MPASTHKRVYGVRAMHQWGLLGLFYLGTIGPIAIFEQAEESAIIVSLATALAIGAKLAWNLIDRKLPKEGNGSVERVCFMGQGAADRLIERMDTHDQKMVMILEQLVELSQRSVDIEHNNQTSLALIADALKRRAR